MTTLEELWPLFGLRVRCGPLEMRPVQDADLPEVLAVVQGGIHEPERMPFYFPWTDATGDEQVRNTLQHYWRSRAEVSPEKWSIELGVWRDGCFRGIQAVSTQDFAVTRTGETGSWLGMPYQGRGTGTLMRQAICVLCFDHLGFTEITSGAFLDNPESWRSAARSATSRTAGSGSSAATPARSTAAAADAGGAGAAAVRVEVEGVAAYARLLGIERRQPRLGTALARVAGARRGAGVADRNRLESGRWQ